MGCHRAKWKGPTCSDVSIQCVWGFRRWPLLGIVSYEGMLWVPLSGVDDLGTCGRQGQVAGVARELSTFGFKVVDRGHCHSHCGLWDQMNHKLGSLNDLILSIGGQEVQDPGADRVKKRFLFLVIRTLVLSKELYIHAHVSIYWLPKCMAMRAYYHSSWAVEAGGSQVGSQLGLHCFKENKPKGLTS